MTYALTDGATDVSVMVGRCVRRSLRDPEAFFTALTLPVILMLLFVYIFGGAMASAGNGQYAQYVVPGLIVLCAGFGAGTTAVAVATDMSSGIVDRFRSMPITSSSFLAGHIAASLARNLLATALVIGVGLAVGWRPTSDPVRWLAAIAMIVVFILALSWLAAAAGLLVGSPEAANSVTMGLMFLPVHRVRPGGDHDQGAPANRGQPAVHPDHRDHARPVDGPHLNRREHRPRGHPRGHLLRRHHRAVRRGRGLPLPPPRRGLSS